MKINRLLIIGGVLLSTLMIAGCDDDEIQQAQAFFSGHPLPATLLAQMGTSLNGNKTAISESTLVLKDARDSQVESVKDKAMKVYDAWAKSSDGKAAIEKGFDAAQFKQTALDVWNNKSDKTSTGQQLGSTQIPLPQSATFKLEVDHNL